MRNVDCELIHPVMARTSDVAPSNTRCNRNDGDDVVVAPRVLDGTRHAQHEIIVPQCVARQCTLEILLLADLLHRSAITRTSDGHCIALFAASSNSEA